MKMNRETWQHIDFVRFYVTAMLRGSPVELMRKRYPDYEFDVGPDHFSLCKKLVGKIDDPDGRTATPPPADEPQPVEADNQAGMAAVDAPAKDVPKPVSLLLNVT